eukprot:TRINITY_DN32564_c0_g1_i1.p1 TRINITY_DN32564_c0_g1~~TRINITY_DN32564_c0_g1_i1.p1  ORF type:complete len:961 (-),score=196.42 TRINITY_DN32564_c0_g1_i1:8-2809(-)
MAIRRHARQHSIERARRWPMVGLEIQQMAASQHSCARRARVCRRISPPAWPGLLAGVLCLAQALAEHTSFSTDEAAQPSRVHGLSHGTWVSGVIGRHSASKARAGAELHGGSLAAAALGSSDVATASSSLLRREARSGSLTHSDAPRSSKSATTQDPEQCVCRKTWTSSRCSDQEDENEGCPAQACDDSEDRWCVVEKYPCASTVTSALTSTAWAACDDGSPVAATSSQAVATTAAPGPEAAPAVVATEAAAAPSPKPTPPSPVLPTPKPSPAVWLCECDREFFFGRLQKDQVQYCYQQFGCNPTTVTLTTTSTTTVAPRALHVCEDQQLNETACNAMGCCDFDGNLCWSAVGGEMCHKGQASANLTELSLQYPKRRGCINGAKLFENDIYGSDIPVLGWNATIQAGLYNSTDLSPLSFPNRVSSVRVYQGCELYLYMNDGFTGEHIILPSGQYSSTDLRIAGMNENSTVKSVKLEVFVMPTPVPTPAPTIFGTPDSVNINFEVRNIEGAVLENPIAKKAFKREVMEEISAVVGDSCLPEDVAVEISVKAKPQEIPLNIMGLPIASYEPERREAERRMREVPSAVLEIKAAAGIAPGVNVQAVLDALGEDSLPQSIAQALNGRFGCFDAPDANASAANSSASNASSASPSSGDAASGASSTGSTGGSSEDDAASNIMSLVQAGRVRGRQPENATTGEASLANSSNWTQMMSSFQEKRTYCRNGSISVGALKTSTKAFGHPVLKISLTLENLDFSTLQKSEELTKSLRGAIVKMLAVAAGVPEDEVTDVGFADGSIRVSATVRLQHLEDMTAGQVAQRLENRAAESGNSSLGSTILAAVTEVDGIVDIMQGNVTVRDISLSVEDEGETSTTETTTTATPTTTTSIHSVELLPLRVPADWDSIELSSTTGMFQMDTTTGAANNSSQQVLPSTGNE